MDQLGLRVNCTPAELAALLNISPNFATIEPRFLEALLAKCGDCVTVAEELDNFLEQQVRRRNLSPAKESSVLSLLQAVWQRIDAPGSAEAARTRAIVG